MRTPSKAGAGFLTILVAASFSIGQPIIGKTSPWEVAMNSGRASLKTGDYAEARRSLGTALDESKMFRTGDPRLAETYEAFGELYLGDQDYPQAKEYFNRALMAEQAIPGYDELKMADTLFGLATATEMLGDREMAVILLKRVKEIWTKSHGPRSAKLISVLKPLGIYATVIGDWKVAENCYRDLLATEEQLGDKEGIGSALNLLAGTLTREGKLDEAQTYADRAVTVLSGSKSTVSLETASDNLAFIKQQRTGVEEKVTPPPVQIAVNVPETKVPPGEVKETKVTPQVVKETKAAPPVVTETKITVTPLVTKATTSVTETKVSPPAVTPAGVNETKVAVVAVKETKAPQQIEPKSDTSTTQKVLTTPPNAPVATTASDFHPWELKDASQAVSSQTAPNTNWGRIRYLAGGKLISKEEYQAMLLANEAYELVRTEKYRMAADILKKALNICPTLASAHTNLGMALTQLGENQEAINHLRQAIAIDPSRGAAWLNLASAFQLSGQLKESLVTYSEYVHRFPNEPLAPKASEIAKNLNKEVQDQEAIARKGEPSATDYFAYASNEGPTRWADAQTKLRVYFAPADGVPGYKSEYDGFASDAFKQWSSASKDKVAFEFVDSPQTANIEWRWTNDVAKVSSVAEGGETNVQYANGKIKHATVTVLTKNPATDSPLSPNQIRAVALHEIGHALGLHGHSPKPDDIMFCSMPPASTKPNLSARDVNTISKLYTNGMSYVRKYLSFLSIFS